MHLNDQTHRRLRQLPAAMGRYLVALSRCRVTVRRPPASARGLQHGECGVSMVFAALFKRADSRSHQDHFGSSSGHVYSALSSNSSIVAGHSDAQEHGPCPLQRARAAGDSLHVTRADLQDVPKGSMTSICDGSITSA